uniref:AIP3 domain-containing protein n=1 Tax=Schistosoma mansoni TaxID=6183 RepID=A0A3Q0KPJ2_SCHMA
MSSQRSQLLISSQSLTTMDTNTNVTNSPLASVNPTAVPCGQCLITSTQNILSGQQNQSTGHRPQLSHNIAGIQKSTHTVVHAAGVPAVMETYVQGNRGLIAHYPLGTNTLHEIQTLPRVVEQVNTTTGTGTVQQSQFGANYRPILIANTAIKGRNTPGSNSLPNNQTYQMIAYPRQALNIVQAHGKNSHALPIGTINTTTGATNCGNTHNNLMLASVITPECLTTDSSNNAARIAHLLAPSGTHPTAANSTHIGGNAQLLVYYPQQSNTGIKVHAIGSPQSLPATATPTTTIVHSTQVPSTINVAIGSVTSGISTSGIHCTPISGNHVALNSSTIIQNEDSTNTTATTNNNSSSSNQPQQPYTIYYALPTNDLLRQLKLNHQAIQIDSSTSSRPQIIQTPAGLMFVQYPSQYQQSSTGSSSPSKLNTGSQHQQNQQIQNDNTLPRNTMTSTKHNIQPIGVVNTGVPVNASIIGSHVDSNTLPRHTRVEHVQGSGLICTCPPEVHQAIFEQQKKRQQNQPSTMILTGLSPLNKISTITTTTGTITTTMANNSSNANSTIFEVSEMVPGIVTRNSPNVTVVKENGLLTRSCTEKFSEDDLNNQKKNLQQCHLTNCTSGLSNTTTDTLRKTIQSQTVNHNSTMNHQLSDEITEKEAHVNYLVTLFQALKSSGVQADAFKEAFERIDLPVTNSKLSPNSINLHDKKQTLLKTKLYQIDEMRKSIKSFYQLINEFNRKFTLDIDNCNKIVTKLSNQQTSVYHTILDPKLEMIQNERRNLDRSLQEMYKINTLLSEQLHDLECVIEQTGNDVLQHRCRINLPYVQTLENRLDSINSTVSLACGHYPDIQQLLNNREEMEIKAIEIQKSVLDDQLYQLKDVNEKCKRIKGTILTLKRLAIVNIQNRQRSNSPRRFTHLGGFVNRAAADRGSIERSRLYAAVQNIQPDSEKRLQAIRKQEMLAIQKRRVFSNENLSTNTLLFTTLEGQKSLQNKNIIPPVLESDKSLITPKELKTSTTSTITMDNEKRAPLAAYSDDSLSSTNTTSTIDSSNNNELIKIHQLSKGFNPDTITSMMDESSDSTLENVQSIIMPTSILKSSTTNSLPNSNSPKQRNRLSSRGSRGVMFNTTVTVDDGSEVVRLNCTLDDSELSKNKVPPTDRSNSSPLSRIGGMSDRFSRSKSPHVSKIATPKSGLSTSTVKGSTTSNNNSSEPMFTSQVKGETKSDTSLSNLDFPQTSEFGYNAPTPPPRRSSQVTTTTANTDEDNTLKSTTYSSRQDSDKIETVSSMSNKRQLPLPTNNEVNENVTSPCE